MRLEELLDRLERYLRFAEVLVDSRGEVRIRLNNDVSIGRRNSGHGGNATTPFESEGATWTCGKSW